MIRNDTAQQPCAPFPKMEVYDIKVACLSGIIDLQKSCQAQKVKFSPDTNRFLLHLTLKKVGPYIAQKLVSKLVEKGEITWENDEDWEVEQILDHIVEEGKTLYLIKWRGWSNSHNTWEPREHLMCEDLLEEYHATGRKVTKRKLSDNDEDGLESKRSRLDEIFKKLEPINGKLSPLSLLSLSSPKKGRIPNFKGLASTGRRGQKSNMGNKLLNPRSKAYRQTKEEVKVALKEWEKQLNEINTDPAPLFVENLVDLEGPPENFEYINDYKPGTGMEIPDDPIVGCECDNCPEEGCCPLQCGAEFAYYKYKRLRVRRGTPIYECNKRCKCGPECPNRVVQFGRKFKLCIFRTANGRGWGVKTLQKIKRGSFVVEYVGEVISYEEAEARGKKYDAVGRTYLFDLDYNEGDDCPFTVDAGYYGNVSHFINHSCDPNLEVFGVWINTLDPRLPRIALFSRRDIDRGEELTFDYMMTGDTINQTNGEVESVSEKSSVTNDACSDVVGEDADLNGDNLSVNNEILCQVPNNAGDSVVEDGEQSSQCLDVDNTRIEVPLPKQKDPPMSPMKETTAGIFESPMKTSIKKSPINMAPNFPLLKGGNIDLATTILPKSITDQYRVVCQCGAKNCRKYLF